MKSNSKLKLFYAIEIIVWVLIISFTVGSIKYHYAKKNGELRAYRVFLQDVDGLIEGSSVRMMGVPIGYVKTISIVQDMVYVKFILTDKNVVLPQGVIATVEFNGMAGSKSLELYSPDDVSKASGNLIVVKKTNRLGSALSLFDDMFAKLDSIIVRCGSFSSALTNIMPQPSEEKEKATVEDAEKSVGYVNGLIEYADTKRTEIMKNLKPKDKVKDNSNLNEETGSGEISDGQE